MTELEKAMQVYCQEHNDDCFEAVGDECPFIGKAFKAGAEWQKQQFRKIENYQEEGWYSNSKDEEFIYGISFDEPIKLPVEFYVKKK